MTSTDVAIVGGGIAGLAAAHRLHTLAPELGVTLLEREAHPGGKIVSERAGGFVIEGGPDCFLSRKRPGIALCEELGIAHRLQGRIPAFHKTFVLRDGTLHRLPEGLSGMVPADLGALAQSGLISPAGQARLAAEPEVPPATSGADESLAHFMRRRLGDEVFDHLVEPLLAGIYAGDAARLSIASTFPHLQALEREHGSLLRGLAAQNAKSQSSERYPPFVAFPNGMAELVEALVARLERTTLWMGATVASLRWEGDSYHLQLADGRALQARAVILATPAFVTAHLLAPWAPALAEAHRAIPYASTATVTLGYEQSSVPVALDGYGYLIPRAAGREVLACTWVSSKWAGRAPDEHVLLRLFLGRFGGRDLLAESDEGLLALARDELASTLAIRGEPRLARVHRWPHAMPQYTLGHQERLQAIERALPAHPGLWLAGAAYRGVGIPDCIGSGEQAAAQAASFVRQRALALE